MSHLKKQPSGGHAVKSSGGSKGGSHKGLLVVAVIIAVIVITGVIFSPTIHQSKEVIGNFETACNDLDVSQMLSCMNPLVANPLRAALLVGGAVTNTNVSEMLPKIFDALGGGLDSLTSGSGLDMEHTMQNMKIKPNFYGIPWMRARTVRCKITVDGFVGYMKITIKKKHGDCFISKVKFD